MITTINDFKIMLETVGHMGFMPELSTTDTDSDNDTSDTSNQLDQLTLSLLSLKVLEKFSTGILNQQQTIDEIKKLYLKYSPYPDVVTDPLIDFKTNGLTPLVINWFGDIDNDYLMEHPDYDLYNDEINNLIYKIRQNLK